MRQLMLIFQTLPMILVFASILALVVQLAEFWQTRQGLAYATTGISGESSAERLIFMSAFLRLILDFLWNLGFAAVILAATNYLEKTK